MLDLDLLERIQLRGRPRFQRVVAGALLAPNYNLGGVRITLEGTEHLPEHPVFFAMNHTDRYNYWPFQYRLWRQIGRYTATWVKGKYFRHPALSKFMELTNNIPTVSRGYLISQDFVQTLGRKPEAQEYRAIRDFVDGTSRDTSSIPVKILEYPRDVLGLSFDPRNEPYNAFIHRLFSTMVLRFNALNAKAFEAGLDVLVFPQGTRSKRLSRGHIGLAEMAIHLQKDIVPVGCNGSDQAYPGGSPVARNANIVYRIGPPIRFEDMAPYVPDEPFIPVIDDDPSRHKRFQALTDHVMERINDLLDPEYQYSSDLASDGVDGTARFV